MLTIQFQPGDFGDPWKAEAFHHQLGTAPSTRYDREAPGVYALPLEDGAEYVVVGRHGHDAIHRLQAVLREQGKVEYLAALDEYLDGMGQPFYLPHEL